MNFVYSRSLMGLIVLLIAIIQGSCTTNKVDKVYSGSMALKPFNFQDYADDKAGDKPYLGNTWGYVKRRAISGSVVWYDHYFRKKHVAQYGGAGYLVLGIAGERYQTPGIETYFPLLHTGSKNKCHYFIQLFACENTELSSGKKYREQRMIIRNYKRDQVYGTYIILRMKDVNISNYIDVITSPACMGVCYIFITGIRFKRDYTIYNKDKTRKLITFYRGSYINFDTNAPFYFKR